MRVLHIGKFFPPFAGGMEYFLADLLRAQQQQGIQAAALVHHHHHKGLFGAKSPDEQLSPPALIYRAPCYGRWLYAPISPQFPLWLARVIRDFTPDILHLHMPNTSAFWAMSVPTAKRIPWVIHWHADVVPSEIDRRLSWAYWGYRPLEQRLLAASRGVIVTSPPYLASSEALKRWQAKCHVVPLGLDPVRIPEPEGKVLAAAAQLWGEAAFKILAVGRLTYYKGYEVLIRAVAKRPDWRLVIVGEGDYRHRLAAVIDTLKLKDRVSLLGFQTNAMLYALFASCDVFCLASVERTEAFGMVLLEAMRFQKPVIASDIPGSGVGWVVRQGGHGVLVPPGDDKELTRSLQGLALDPAQRQRLGRMGGERLRQTFHISQIAGQIQALYRISSGPGSRRNGSL